MNATSLEDLCHSLSTGSATALRALLPSEIRAEVGHFNVFELDDVAPTARSAPAASFPCRTYYKISLLTGNSRAEYPDEAVDISRPTLLFSTPKTPSFWLPQGPQTARFCVFTAEFLQPTRSGVMLDELPIFKSEGYPVFALSDKVHTRVQTIFDQMKAEIASDYAYKYDLLRTYALELIHLGQKLQVAKTPHPSPGASARLTALFVELLERQFPLKTPHQHLRLRSAKEYADQLSVHVNYLNKVVKETTGLTTTELIAGRIVQEAKALLTQTDWTIAELSDSLGFADVAHFAKFFKRETAFAPGAFRSQSHSLNYT
ncbi:helix-turn-helix domain-containing protein [Spirosoma utsteinense]|uniref:AraC-like DNA-binding protein n=1 Tax=Spirosoma utsteinense TaxID=2585773 RepID=A0ABR6WDN4_9BACT|nr:AraC family transcriptional regulator [Spirosoma utsteinense]MBC3794634.1 AraC-like DNA-binding protein [Spirosoma utsteinense]